MHHVYSMNQLGLLRKKRRQLTILGTVLVSLVFSISILLCFFVNDVNANAIKLINIVLCSCGGCVGIYVWRELILPLKARIIYVERVSRDTQEQIIGTVSSVDHVITLQRYIKARELRVLTDNQLQQILYLDTNEQYASLIGKRIAFSVASNTIVGYEVLE